MSSTIQISHPTKIAKGTIYLSGSKSISNRALIIRALCKDNFKIENLSNSEDTQTLLQLLESEDLELNAGHAGTTYRFLTAYCAALGRETLLSGSERMHDRPIGGLVKALKSIGANIIYEKEKDFPPIRILPTDITGGKVNLQADISSQFITALLLVAPTLSNGLHLVMESEPVSKPYIEMTLSVMEYFGISYTWVGLEIKIIKQDYVAKDFFVESDWSSASYLYAIAAISDQAEITIHGLTDQKIQGDNAISDIMQSFGIDTIFGDNQIRISKNSNKPIGFYEYDFISQPDLVQTISVLAAAKGTTLLMTGLQTLAIKETDRLKALKKELKKVKTYLTKLPPRFAQKTEIQYYMQEGKAEYIEDFIINTYNDHRMAMAFAPLSIQIPLRIEDHEVVQKSYPNYWNDLRQLGFVVKAL